MTTYLLKSILCLAILLLVYQFFLEKEKMHRFNRWYLLGSIVFACVVPLISFKVSAEALPVLQNNYFDIFDHGSDKVSQIPVSSLPAVPIQSANYFTPALWIIYGSVTFILLIRFIKNIYLLLSSVSKNKILNYHGASLVLLKEKVASHSFFNYIFISEEDYAKRSIEKEVITHELTHVRERHSLDVIFVEFLQTICWFNPLFFFYKKAIQLNHEYLADEAVIKTFDNVPAYQCLLLDKISLNSNLSLASSFNYSVTKKRLVMMTRNHNQVTILLKKLLLLPLLAVGVFIFSSKQLIAQEKKDPPKENSKDTTKIKSTRPPRVFPWDLPVSTNAAPLELINEFNAIVESKITQGNDKHFVSHLTGEERSRLLTIYRQMNKDQRHDAKVSFQKRLGPSKKVFPTAAQLEKWKNPADYGVWIDEKKVTNDKLNNYKPSDFSHYDASNLAYTEKMKQNVMKAFNLKTMYKVQLDLMTNDYYDKYYKSVMASPEYTMFYHITRDGNREVEVHAMIIENN